MKKILCLTLAATLLTCAPAFAKIRSSIDSAHDAVIYYTSKKVDYFSHSGIMRVTKNARQNDDDIFVIRMTYQGHGAHKTSLENTAEVIIDDKTYIINKIINPAEFTSKPQRYITYADFLVTPDIAEKIMNFEDYCWFKFTRKGKEPNTIKMKPYEQEEVRLIAKLKYNDFEAFEKKQIRPLEPKTSKK